MFNQNHRINWQVFEVTIDKETGKERRVAKNILFLVINTVGVRGILQTEVHLATEYNPEKPMPIFSLTLEDNFNITYRSNSKFALSKTTVDGNDEKYTDILDIAYRAWEYYMIEGHDILNVKKYRTLEVDDAHKVWTKIYPNLAAVKDQKDMNQLEAMKAVAELEGTSQKLAEVISIVRLALKEDVVVDEEFEVKAPVKAKKTARKTTRSTKSTTTV